MKQFRDTPYYVTEDGKVYRYWPKRKVKNGINKKTGKQAYVNRPEKWDLRKPFIDSNGYYYVSIWGNNKEKRFQTHRMVAELYCDGYFEGAHVDHIDCNTGNNHYTNLQWCSSAYNSKKGNNPNYPLFTSGSK